MIQAAYCCIEEYLIVYSSKIVKCSRENFSSKSKLEFKFYLVNSSANLPNK